MENIDVKNTSGYGGIHLIGKQFVVGINLRSGGSSGSETKE